MSNNNVVIIGLTIKYKYSSNTISPPFFIGEILQFFILFLQTISIFLLGYIFLIVGGSTLINPQIILRRKTTVQYRKTLDYSDTRMIKGFYILVLSKQNS